MTITLLLALFFLPLVLPQAQDQCDDLYPNAIRGPAVIKGRRFFDSVTGNYIPIKGIAYYPRPNAGELSISDSVDYFAEEYRYIWEPDLENLKELGVNTVRIYAVDPTVDHSAFMCALQQNGMYVIVGLLADCKNCGIGPDIADLDTCYPASLKTRGQYIIQVFSRYPNVLGFCAGNEVSLYATNKTVEANAPCQKQFMRDMRAYIDSCDNIQEIPVGVATADPSFEVREMNAKYYNCRSDPEDTLENAEWYGINAYQHCDGAAQTIDDLVGYMTLLQNFSSYYMSIPVMVSEFGCRSRGFEAIGDFAAQRTWLQVDALYSEDYIEEFVGGVVFEYSAEKRIVDTSSGTFNPWPYYGFMKLQYGVTYYAPVDCNHDGIRCENNKYPEFDLLAAKFTSINANTIGAPNMDEYDPPDSPATECPDSIAPLSDFDWPSASEKDFWCPPTEINYTCPCATTLAPTTEPTSSPSPGVPASPTIARPPGFVPTEPIFQATSDASRVALFGTTHSVLSSLLVFVYAS